ncbi:pantothenate synthetase [Marinobacterium nitratireducens]|uniref:Pantothenate synthetase n=1 Tax=Marinobacterium nitratireducens TaxID=518897 RepID=A0A918DXH7_9GAMM|nr:pantoate--beta-alanine ligase [Marinobacterium nitratireducens]GGO88590.1 pantothenate synthetase [Marinobacterium nitratireducens]
MQTLNRIADLREALRQPRRDGKRIALVPTMGNLHRGHLELVREARRHADIVVATIFVNPLQFGANEDLDSYPRTLADDQAGLEAEGCDFLFAPSEAEMYPNGRENQTIVEVPGLSDMHCGATRPGHFRGVTTVVSKLFGIVQPDCAFFGTKDYQQLLVIRRMVADLCLPIAIHGVAIVRDEHGLALSSRNGYLTPEELAVAPTLSRVLRDTAAAIEAGETDYDRLAEDAQQQLEAAGFRRDFVRILRRSNLEPATGQDRELVILSAGYLGAARLIDNIEVNR